MRIAAHVLLLPVGCKQASDELDHTILVRLDGALTAQVGEPFPEIMLSTGFE